MAESTRGCTPAQQSMCSSSHKKAADQFWGWFFRGSESILGLRVEFLLKTESGYLRDAEAT